MAAIVAPMMVSVDHLENDSAQALRMQQTATAERLNERTTRLRHLVAPFHVTGKAAPVHA